MRKGQTFSVRYGFCFTCDKVNMFKYILKVRKLKVREVVKLAQDRQHPKGFASILTQVLLTLKYSIVCLFVF